MDHYLCPDCSDAHAEPAEAGLGHHARCLECQLEVDLAVELSLIARAIAA